jgi:hypothetical protein
VTTLHISQDDTKCWQLTFEDDAGTLTLISHSFPSPDHLVDDARNLIAEGKVPPTTVIMLGPPSGEERSESDPPYCKPSARRANA